MWPWYDQRHISAQHVEQLWQFVETGATKNGPDAGHAGIVTPGLANAGVRIWIVMHAAKLVDHDAIVVETIALLAEQHWSTAVDLDQKRNEQEHRCQERQEHERKHDVFGAFQRPSPARQRSALHCEGRNSRDQDEAA